MFVAQTNLYEEESERDQEEWQDLIFSGAEGLAFAVKDLIRAVKGVEGAEEALRVLLHRLTMALEQQADEYATTQTPCSQLMT